MRVSTYFCESVRKKDMPGLDAVAVAAGRLINVV
jgi:hypothetical protein